MHTPYKYKSGIRVYCSSVGSDESGTGGLFGKCSFAAFKLTSENLEKLKNCDWFFKITDSKKLSDEENIEILQDIKKKFLNGKDYLIWNMETSTYNSRFLKFYNTDYNKHSKKSSDRVKCLAHNWIHKKLHESTTFHVIDNFLGTETWKYYECPPNHEHEILPIDKFFDKGGLNNLSIALASILARGSYLENLKNLNIEGLKIEISDDDNHHKPPSILEIIFKKLKEKGIDREYVYSNYCKIDQVKKYKKELKRLKII